ncbi:MAG: acyl-CoA thioesterase [Bacteriovoracaceae bacterium]
MKLRNKQFSQVISKYIVMPQHANPTGLMFGGVLIGWMDMAAAMVAEKHSGMNVATVSIEKVIFSSPIHVGDHVTISAEISEIGNTSMKISVSVDAESAKSGTTRKTTDAILTFVAVDHLMRPVTIPQLINS